MKSLTFVSLASVVLFFAVSTPNATLTRETPCPEIAETGIDGLADKKRLRLSECLPVKSSLSPVFRQQSDHKGPIWYETAWQLQTTDCLASECFKYPKDKPGVSPLPLMSSELIVVGIILFLLAILGGRLILGSTKRTARIDQKSRNGATVIGRGLEDAFKSAEGWLSYADIDEQGTKSALNSSGRILPTQKIAINKSGLIGVISDQGPKATQDDFADSLALPELRVVAIADGVSSSTNGAFAAEIAVHTAIQDVAATWLIQRKLSADDLKQSIRFTQAMVSQRIQAAGLHQFSIPPSTTLIVAAETAQHLVLGYIGDGAAIITSGSLQWATNLLHPQSSGGVMMATLGMNPDLALPVVIEWPKVLPDGEVVIIGTDGIFQPGSILTTSNQILAAIKASIGSIESGRMTLEKVLMQWVSENCKTGDDNRSLGLLITNRALELWR